MWIPGYTTRDSGAEIRNPSPQGIIPTQMMARGLILAPQYTRYGLFAGYMGDILTIQKIKPPANQRIQTPTVDIYTKQDMLPRNQLSDLLAMRAANNQE